MEIERADFTARYLELSVPATGPALPIQEAGPNASSAVSFAWNQPTTVTAPAASQIYSSS